MPKFKSKPHKIEAFQFRKDIKLVPPQWFKEAYERNEAQITMSEKYGYYITIYGKDQTEVAREGYWVCYYQEKIFVLSDEKFKKSYE